MNAETVTSVALLAQADALLTDGARGGRQSVRIACWITRSALEQRVDELLTAKGWEAGGASMHSRLSCLESAYAADERDLVARAEFAWSALSRLCHHHAYELTPTVSEARHLGEVVAGLEAA